MQAFQSLPLSFEPNRGQTDPDVKFLSRSRSHTVFLTGTEMVLDFTDRDSAPSGAPQRSAEKLSLKHPSRTSKSGKDLAGVVRVKLVASNSAPKVSGTERLPGFVNYLIGNDPRRWQT
ncbi:MAG: hypothetical protein DMG22_18885, partial [Acidobacteria bacterium]